jgi:hypothetical protein
MPASTAGVTGALAPPSNDVEAVVLGDGARAGITGEDAGAGATAGAIAAAGSAAGKGADCRLDADSAAAAAGAGAARTEKARTVPELGRAAFVVLVVLAVAGIAADVGLGFGATVGGEGVGDGRSGSAVGTGRGRLVGSVIGAVPGKGMGGNGEAEAGWEPSESTRADRLRVGRVASARRVVSTWVPPHRGLRQRSWRSAIPLNGRPAPW